MPSPRPAYAKSHGKQNAIGRELKHERGYCNEKYLHCMGVEMDGEIWGINFGAWRWGVEVDSLGVEMDNLGVEVNMQLRVEMNLISLHVTSY